MVIRRRTGKVLNVGGVWSIIASSSNRKETTSVITEQLCRFNYNLTAEH